MRAAAGNYKRIGNEILLTIDEVTTHRWNVLNRTPASHITFLRMTFAKVVDKSRKCFLTWSQQDGVGMQGRLVGQGCDMQSAHGHV